MGQARDKVGQEVEIVSNEGDKEFYSDVFYFDENVGNAVMWKNGVGG